MAAIRIAAVVRAVCVCLAVALAGCDYTKAESSATLVVESTPISGAEVMVDGASYGKTPATVEGLPAQKVVLVHVTHEDYKPNWRNVTVPEDGEERVLIELEPRVGYVSVDSTPPGAEVFLDGAEPVGKTPLRDAPFPVGEHTYQLRLDKFQTLEKAVSVEEDYRYKFLHELKPKQGLIKIVSHPGSANVWLNDQLQDETTPTEFEVVPGTYTVSVHAKGYIMSESTVTVGPSEEKTVTLDMEEGEAPLGMVLVPAGEFLMGVDNAAPDERPQRKVNVDAFYIDKYEVTNAEYKQAVAGHKYPSGEDNFPVTGVTWEEAVAYAKALGKRLPSEEEWEKAARGVDAREFPWGNKFDASLCNSKDKPNLGEEEVGKYRAGASPYGCMDMSGNVYEWTDSWYNAYPGNMDVTKDYGQVYRVLRGGSYMTDQFAVRCARRHFDRATSTRADYGFRCAKDVEAGPRRTQSASRR